MAITDPKAVRFCNEQIRPSCDKLTQFYWFIKAVKQEYLATPGLATAIPSSASEVVADGADTDGRTQITGADVQAALTHLNTLIASLEANNAAMLNLFHKIAVNIH